MSGECPSSGNQSWKNGNAAPLCVSRETIDSADEEGQCRISRRGADGGIHDDVRGEIVIESVNGVDETSPQVHAAPSLKLLQHLLNSQKAWRQF